MSDRHYDDTAAVVGRWMLGAVIAGSTLALGSVHSGVLIAVATGATAATALLWWDASPTKLRAAAKLLIAVAIGLIAWTALQSVPLPIGLLEKIAAANADVWSRCLSPLHEAGPSFASISLDPIATRVEVLKGITYLSVFLGALRLAQHRSGVTVLERMVVATAVVAASAALLHPAFGADRVFGLYEPRETYAYVPHHIGPLLNTNHLAAYANIGLLIAFGAVVETRETLNRWLAVVIVLLLGATCIWSGSRGGAAAMLFGAIVVGVVVITRRPGSWLRRSLGIAGLVVGVLAAGGAALMLFETTRDKLARNDLGKIDLVENALKLLNSYGWFGIGRGAFESTFPAIRVGAENYVFTHPEDVVAQWTTEWGAPVAVVAMVAIAVALRPKTVLTRSRPPAGAWAALIAVALQNLVDFSSEIPSVMIAATVCAAIITGGTGGARGGDRDVDELDWKKRCRLAIAALAAATAIAALLVEPFVDEELYADERQLRDLALSPGLTMSAFHIGVRAAMLRHPAEPYFPFVGAVRSSAARDENILPWAGRALERSPVYGRVHILLARSLFMASPAQARLEYRLACEQDASVCKESEGARLVKDYDSAMELVPAGPRGVAVLSSLTDLLERRLPSSVVRLDRQIIARDPSAVGPARRAAAAALSDLRNAAPWCLGSEQSLCLANGLEEADQLRKAAPTRCDGYYFTAELRVAQGDIDGALGDLRTILPSLEDRSNCARRFVSLALETKDKKRVAAATDQLLNLGCDKETECIDNLRYVAEIEKMEGNERQSVALLKKASNRAPERDDLLLTLAHEAEAQGLHGEALEAYTHLSERHPGDPEWQERAKHEKEALARGLFAPSGMTSSRPR